MARCACAWAPCDMHLSSVIPLTTMTDALPHSTTDLTWRPGPRHPRLAERVVHVWRADLTLASDELLDVLSTDEHARAERILSRRTAALWARSRGVLRSLLGRYLESDPSTIRFE